MSYAPPSDLHIREHLAPMEADLLAATRKEPIRRQQRSRARRAGFVSLLAAAAVTAIVVGNATGFLGGGKGATAQAAEVLNAAAEITISQADPVVAPGQYLKIDTSAVYITFSRNASGEKIGWLHPSTSVIYKPADEADEWVQERHELEPTTFFGEGAQAEAMTEWATTRDNSLTNGIFRQPGGGFWAGTVDYAQDIPRDPHELYDYISSTYRGGSNNPDEDAWVRITDMLRTGTLPGEMRASLYGAAALIPGVDVVEGDVTLDGRTGIALGRVEPSRSERRDIIIDPETGQLIGERVVLTEDWGAIPAGTATESTAVQTTVVDTAP